MDDAQWELACALMAQLAAATAAGKGAQSAARLCKSLGVRMSTLQRCLSYLGTEKIGEEPGLNWVVQSRDEDRLLLALSAQGQAQWDAWQNEEAALKTDAGQGQS